MADREYMRRLVDEILGPARNAQPGDAATGRALHYDSPDVCRPFLVAFCPHALLAGTKGDLGPCPARHHEPRLRDELGAALTSGSRDAARAWHRWETDFARLLSRLVREADGRVQRARLRSGATEEGAAGEGVDVCDTCAAILPADDAVRIEAHFGGRLHNGWARMRMALLDLERRGVCDAFNRGAPDSRDRRASDSTHRESHSRERHYRDSNYRESTHRDGNYRDSNYREKSRDSYRPSGDHGRERVPPPVATPPIRERGLDSEEEEGELLE